MESKTINPASTAADDPTVSLAVSPKEINLILTAMNLFNEGLYNGAFNMADETKETWHDLLDYIQEKALNA